MILESEDLLHNARARFFSVGRKRRDRSADFWAGSISLAAFRSRLF